MNKNFDEEKILEYVKLISDKTDKLYHETIMLHPSHTITEMNIELTIKTP